MNVLDAIRAVEAGHIVVSCAGRTYTVDDLTPIRWIGERAVSHAAVLTKEERRGTWDFV